MRTTLKTRGKYQAGLDLQMLSSLMSLPFIRGFWFFVDPYEGSVEKDGHDIYNATTLRHAYDMCTSGRGDGIAILAREDETTAHTTNYLGGTLVFAKSNVTVVGIGGAQTYNARARIASKDRAYAATTQFSWTGKVITDSRAGFLTAGFEVGDVILATAAAGTAITSANLVTAVTASTLTVTDALTENLTPGVSIISTHCIPVLQVTGRNNVFKNIGIVQNGDTAADIGGLLVSDVENAFINCYVNGAGHATQAAETTAYDLALNSSECLFKDCIFGSNSTIRAAANAHIRLGVGTTQIGQNWFKGCDVVSYSATAGHMAVAITNAATLGGWIHFDANCRFVNWNSGAVTALTAAIGGGDSDNMGILCDAAYVGWAILVDAGWDNVYTSRPIAAAHGGRGILVE